MNDLTAIATVLERKDMGDGSEIVLCKVSADRYVTWRRDLKSGATTHAEYWTNVTDAGINFLARTSPL